MANSPSARKRIRQNAKHRAVNRWRKHRIKEQTKRFLQAVHDHKLEEAEQEFRRACGLLDKIACTSTIHRNAAARRKSRLAKRLNQARAKAA